MSHQTERMQKPGVRVARPVAGPTEAARNLTYERQLAYLARQKSEALAKIGASEVVVTAVPKLKDGKPVKDAEGFDVLIDKKRLKRDVVAEEFDSRIADHRKRCGLAE